MRLGHSFNHEFPILHVDATTQSRLASAGFFEAVIGQQFNVALRHIRERLRGGARVGGRHVCDAIVDDAFFNVYRIVVRGRA